MYGCKPASVGSPSLEGQKFDGVTLSVSCIGLLDRQIAKSIQVNIHENCSAIRTPQSLSLPRGDHPTPRSMAVKYSGLLSQFQALPR